MLEELRIDVENARRELERVLRARSNAWHCPHCGHDRTYDGQWWRADLLYEAAGVDGPAAMIALFGLVGSGLVEMDSRLRLRWALAMPFKQCPSCARRTDGLSYCLHCGTKVA